VFKLVLRDKTPHFHFFIFPLPPTIYKQPPFFPPFARHLLSSFGFCGDRPSFPSILSWEWYMVGLEDEPLSSLSFCSEVQRPWRTTHHLGPVEWEFSNRDPYHPRLLVVEGHVMGISPPPFLDRCLLGGWTAICASITLIFFPLAFFFY